MPHAHDHHDHHEHGGHDPHGHHHGHHHGLEAGPTDFSRAFAIGIVLNVAFVAIEAGFGWRIDSLALLADALHNLSDVAGLVLAWGAAAAAARLRPDARHTYGWKRAGIVAAFLNALMLLVAMGSLAWEAIHRLNTPQPTDSVVIMAVAAAGIVVNGITAWLFAAGRGGDLNIRGAFLHMAADALVSAGVVVAGALALWTGWRWLDPVVTLAIAAIIVVGTWDLFRRSAHLLFDGVPEGLDTTRVRDYLASLPGVTDVHDLHVWAMGTADTALTAHLVMPAGAPGDALLQAATRGLAERFGIGHVTLQVVSAPFTPACADAGAALAHGRAGAVRTPGPL